MAYSDTVILFGFTAFVDPIHTAFGWSYAQISLAMTLRGIQMGAVGPFVGMAVDRWSPKRLVFIGVIVFGLGLFCLGRVTSLGMFYAAFLIAGLGSALSVGFVSSTMVARWFRKNIGKASGVLALGTGISGMMIPLLVKLIDAYGWQNALQVLAVGLLVLGIPLSFVYRSRPEDYGLQPDGKPQDDLKTPDSLSAYDFSVGVREALTMRIFWFIGIATLFQVASVTAATFHMLPYLASVGMERSSASMVALLVSTVSLVARVPIGILADIIQKKYVVALSIGLVSIGMFLFRLVDGSSWGLIVLFAIIFGVGFGAFMPVRLPLLREYFGTKNFGAILGMTSIFMTVGISTGAPVAGWVYDTFGTYGPIWLILSGVAMLGAILMLTLPSVSRKPKLINS